MNNFKTKHRIRKRVIFLGLCLGLAVNQIMIFQVNRALAIDIVNTTPVTTSTQRVEINPLDVINKVNQRQAESIQNRQNSNQVINYDTNKPLVNYSNPTQQNTIPIYTQQTPQNINSTHTVYYPQQVPNAPNNLQYYVQQPYNENQYYNTPQNYNQVQNNTNTNTKKKKSYSERYKEKYGVTPWQGALLGLVAGLNAGQNVANQQLQRQLLEQQYQMNQIQMMPGPPVIQPYSQPKYRVYDQYGRSQGYIQQSNW